MKKSTGTFISKQDPRIPDGWGIIVEYQDGSKNDEFEGSHRIITIEGDRYLEVSTIEAEVVLIPIGMVKKIKCDKRFSLFIELSRKEQERRAAAAAALKA